MNAPFDLSPRRREVAALNAVGLTPYEIADELGITAGGVRSHLRDARIRVGVTAERPLTHLLLAGGGVDLTRLRTPLCNPVDELTRLVWCGLRYDVPDKRLIATIARADGMPPDDVERALTDLRSTTKLTDCGLLGLAFRTGILSGHEGVTPPWSVPAPVHIGTEPAQILEIPASGSRSCKEQPRPEDPKLRPPIADPLKLLPRDLPNLLIRENSSRHSLLSGLEDMTAVAGIHVQAVRVSVEVCRDVLQRMHDNGIPPERWGPVLGNSEGRYAVFLMQPNSIADRWRYAGSRVLRSGTALHLPPYSAPIGSLYWALTPAIWWDTREVIRLIGGDSAVALALPPRPSAPVAVPGGAR
ncbi:helix-turn-helix transcriptional regulator [Streptomyces sp. NPDC056831]|uniref:helix-turn-helix domain-containing protein n=1 Tax=Streptomyces sp. NPDC056831 TaxID=3345954 RepID=UPI00369A3070